MSIAGLSMQGRLLSQLNRNGKPVAAVLEHTESYTNHTLGAGTMLKRAGFEVILLTPEYIETDFSPNTMVMNYEDADLGNKIRNRIAAPKYKFPVGPDINQIDLLFLGTFTNWGQPYHDYLRQYADQIPAFVEAGGVVCEMNQWGRYSFLHPGFLPEGMKVIRETWSDTDKVVVAVDNHPLVTPWAGKKGQSLNFVTQPRRPGRFYEGRRSWQSIFQWDGMQVLLAAGGGYRRNRSLPHGRAALIEGQHGNGRYLFSSMWIDKLFDTNGEPVAEPETMQFAGLFFKSLKDYVLQVQSGSLPGVSSTPIPPEPLIGPMLGHIDHEQAIIWTRANKPGSFTLNVWKEGSAFEEAERLDKVANLDNDYCLHWKVGQLDANTRYLYRITDEDTPLFDDQVFSFKTGPTPGVHAKVALGFGSCVDQNGRFPELWKQVERSGAEGMVLLGDTPYIDSTITLHQRIKHRQFLSHEGAAYLTRQIPFWGTWDDHDFGANDSDGQLHNRKNARQVFMQYRALTHYGENGDGIYNSFRRGPIEVFLLDLRYFSDTESSFADSNEPTLLGRQQWEWLKKKLKQSDATFKILAGGMTWASKQRGLDADDWASYSYESEAIIDFIGQERITGVVLVGGDIHCTQVMKYDTEDRIGYPLYHIVTSPMHNRIFRQHEDLNHPEVLFARAVPNTFVRIAADTTVEPGLLTIDVIDITGQSVYRLVTGDELGTSVRP